MPQHAVADECAAVPKEECVVATVLCGNSEELIHDAVASASVLVDEILLIDTGISDGSIERARSVANAKLKVVEYTWSDNFANARNFALKSAERCGATWALTLDTDERLDFGDLRTRDDLVKALSAFGETKAWMVKNRQLGYAKERFIRLPCSAEWRGATHEALVGLAKTDVKLLPGVVFWETPKSAEQMTHKLQRDLQILREVTASDPQNARWWFYLGQTHEGLKDYEAAIQAYDTSLEHDDWDEQAAWSTFVSARCSFELGRYTESVDRCAMGMAIKPNYPELFWLAALASYRLGEFGKSVCWGEMAAFLGRNQELMADRYTFRYLPAWFEAPYDVLRFAFRARGEPKRAAEADEQFEEQRAARMSMCGEGESCPGES